MKKRIVFLLIIVFNFWSCSEDETTIVNLDPSVPTNVAYELIFNNVTISWDASTDNEEDDITYELYLLNCDQVDPCNLNAYVESNSPNQITTETSYAFSDLLFNTNYAIGVRALDDNGNKSQLVELFFLSSLEGAPSIPTNVEYDLILNDLTISWDASTDNEGDDITYELYLLNCDEVDPCDLIVYAESNSPNAIITQTNYTFEDILLSENYAIGVRAVDEIGNKSQFTIKLFFLSPSEAAPSTPTNIEYELMFDDVIISWDASTDNEGGNISYELYLLNCDEVEPCDLNAYAESNSPNATIPQTAFTFNNLLFNTNYGFGVRAVDDHGNKSQFAELFFLSWSSTIEGDVILRDQSDVDSFLNGDVEYINGSLFIEPYSNGQGSTSVITDLSPVHGLIEVGGDIILDSYNYYSLHDLSGFESLTTLNGSLIITGFELNNLDALSGITHLGGLELIDTHVPIDVLENLNILEIQNNLVIKNNNNITDVSGFASLTSIGGNLEISNNSSLLALNGFNNLNTISGSLIFENNSTLTTINSLASLSQISSNLIIKDNYELNTISSFNSLNTIYGELKIKKSSLTALSFLENLTHIGKYLWLVRNDQLIDIDGLEILNYLGEGFTIIDNDSLNNLNFNNINYDSNYVFRVYVSQNDILESISGLAELKFASSLYFADNSNLQILDGFSNIERIGNYVTFIDNDSLANLNFLSNLNYIDCGYFSPTHDGNTGNLVINGNFNLTNFCGLTTLFSQDGLCSYEYVVVANGFNPTHVDIINGNCEY